MCMRGPGAMAGLPSPRHAAASAGGRRLRTQPFPSPWHELAACTGGLLPDTSEGRAPLLPHRARQRARRRRPPPASAAQRARRPAPATPRRPPCSRAAALSRRAGSAASPHWGCGGEQRRCKVAVTVTQCRRVTMVISLGTRYEVRPLLPHHDAQPRNIQAQRLPLALLAPVCSWPCWRPRTARWPAAGSACRRPRASARPSGRAPARRRGTRPPASPGAVARSGPPGGRSAAG
jgi:hypothetical protein